MERIEIMAIIALCVVYFIFTVGTIGHLLVAYKDYKKDKGRYNFGYYFGCTDWGAPFLFWWSIFTFMFVLFGTSWWLSSFFVS